MATKPCSPRMVSGRRLSPRHSTLLSDEPFRVRRPFLRSRPMGRAMDAPNVRLTGRSRQLRMVFRLRTIGKQLALGLSATKCSKPRLLTLSSSSPNTCWERISSHASGQNSRSGSICSTRWAAAISRYKCNPRTAYMRDKFGVTYTQDEKLLCTGGRWPMAAVYLGLKSGVDREAMATELRNRSTPRRRAVPS